MGQVGWGWVPRMGTLVVPQARLLWPVVRVCLQWETGLWILVPAWSEPRTRWRWGVEGMMTWG